MNTSKKLAIVTGASAGIGAATAVQLAAAGYDIAICARRADKLAKTAATCEAAGATVLSQTVDICDAEQRAAFVAVTLKKFGKIDLLVNNAGGAKGWANYEDYSEADLRWMLEINVIATHELTKLVLPGMLERDSGDLIFIGSIADNQPYEHGSAYCASKHAQRAMIEALRQEIAASSIRVSTIKPGMVETEFSDVRFAGDRDKAAKVYAGLQPLVADDIADLITFAVTRPPHVNISELHVFPVHQADARKVVRS